MPDPRSDGGSVTIQAIADGTVVYMRSSALGSLPDGREWMALDFSFGDDLSTSLPTNTDPKKELELLEATTGVTEIGKDVVRGVPTTLYSGTVDVSEQVEQLRKLGADHLASLVEQHGNPVRVEVWVNGDGLVQRMRYVSSQPSEDDKPTTIDMRMDFLYLGSVPEIELPDSSDVFDATASIKEKIDPSGD